MASAQYGEKTVPYKTYIKTTLVEALQSVFSNHIDPQYRGVKATIEYPQDQALFPCVIIRFYERDIKNAGVGHSEIIDNQPVKHYLYDGDLELSIHAETSLDRDLISDSVVQTLTMGTLQTYTNNFFQRIYDDGTHWPLAQYNFININTDVIKGFGETVTPVPWKQDQPTDSMLYQTSYRTSVFGEFYSLLQQATVTTIEHVNVYPYFGQNLGGTDPVPTGTPDPAPWLP